MAARLALVLVVVPSAGVIGLGFTGNLFFAIVAMRRREPRMVALHLAASGAAVLMLIMYRRLIPTHVTGGGGVGPG